MFTTKLALNLYIVYEINVWPSNINRKFKLVNSTFGAANLTKILDPDKYSYLYTQKFFVIRWPWVW